LLGEPDCPAKATLKTKRATEQVVFSLDILEGRFPPAKLSGQKPSLQRKNGMAEAIPFWH